MMYNFLFLQHLTHTKENNFQLISKFPASCYKIKMFSFFLNLFISCSLIGVNFKDCLIKQKNGQPLETNLIVTSFTFYSYLFSILTASKCQPKVSNYLTSSFLPLVFGILALINLMMIKIKTMMRKRKKEKKEEKID